METKQPVKVNTTESPESRVVGDYYNHPIFEVMSKLGDGNLHYGYWRDEDDQSTFEQAMDQMTDEMIRRLAPKPGTRILDVGCGNGTPGLRLAKDRQVEVVGITVSERQVARGNERAQRDGLGERARFEHVSAMDLPYEDESFDGAWALESMLHMPDKKQVLSEIARVLRPGGRLAIADMTHRKIVASNGNKQATVTDTTVYAALTEFGEYAKLIEDVGLEPLEVTDVTEETARSNDCFAEWMRIQRDEYVAILGEKGYELLLDNQEAISLMPQLGYVLITARRP
jgi:ubiquinone/menaquinone biosynthesis C-methylase UbiE